MDGVLNMPKVDITIEVCGMSGDGTIAAGGLLNAAMSEAGASAITLQDAEDQPLYEPPPGATPLWQQNRLIALFDADTDLQRVRRQLKQR